jgi:hypothetical protein
LGCSGRIGDSLPRLDRAEWPLAVSMGEAVVIRFDSSILIVCERRTEASSRGSDSFTPRKSVCGFGGRSGQIVPGEAVAAKLADRLRIQNSTALRLNWTTLSNVSVRKKAFDTVEMVKCCE